MRTSPGATMTQQERQGWHVVAALFVAMFLVWGGGVNTGAVFLLPLVEDLGWTRARFSMLGAVGALAAGLASPLVGWLLDRVRAERVMVAGTALTGLSILALSASSSFAPMLASFVLLGAGVAATTVIPASVVVANWFEARRGLAMGITFAGMSIGGTAMTIVASRAIALGGWRVGYVTIALPMFAVVIPLLLALVRTRPGAGGRPDTPGAPGASSAARLPGLELAEACRTRSFWLIVAAQLLFSAVGAGVGVHLVAYLVGLGYGAEAAAEIVGVVYVFNTIGSLAIGPVGDRFGARRVLVASYLAAVVGGVALLFAGHAVMLAVAILLFGTAVGVPVVLIPMVMVESLGLRRLGSLMGVAGGLATIGFAVGPVAAGRIFDESQSYALAWDACVAMSLLSALAIFACRPLARERERLSRARAPVPPPSVP